MPAVTACPDRDVLTQLLLGRVAGREAERLARHLEECDRCAAAVASLPAEDTMVEAVRARGTAADAGEEATVRNLVDLLRQQGPPPADAVEVATGTAGPVKTLVGPDPLPSSTGLEAASVEGRYDFLDPPQGPGELGRLGTYRVLRVLGSGGMGVVFQAEDVHLKRPTALKVMKPEAAARPGACKRFLREARAAALLEHDHIVTIYQVGEERGVPFLAMQWLKGMSLEERLNRPEPLAVPEVLRLGRQIARGLAVAHDSGLIHRDIKPANLWLETRDEPRPSGSTPAPPDGRGSFVHVKILDFGLARDVADDAHLTQSGTILGTPSYMAPEQARGDEVDPRCDLFSLGVVLYRMCTGRLPFPGKSTMAVLSSLALHTPPSPRLVNPDVPPALADLVMQLLDKDAASRPASARAVADRLQALERGAGAPRSSAAASTEVISPPAAGPASRAAPATRRRLLAAAVALLVLLPLGYYYGGTIIRIATDKGELVVEVDDPNVEVSVKQGGVRVEDRKKDRRFVLTAKGGEVEFYDPDTGVRLLTREFTLERGGRTTIRAGVKELADARTPPKDPAPVVQDPDRRAAEWVLSLGGKVAIEKAGKRLEIAAAKELPPAPWQVVSINLRDNQQVTDAALERVEGLTALKVLDLFGTPVGDAGLKHFRALTRLEMLILDRTPVGDAGMGHLRKLTDLRFLGLSETRVGDDGMENFKGMPNLTALVLNGTHVGDAGLAQIQELTSLTDLTLTYTPVSDAGLVHLKKLTSLTYLTLGAKVSDAGLVHLQALTRLRDLSLFGTQVTGPGLKHLKPLPELRTLTLDASQVTDDGLVHVGALPKLTGLGLCYTRVGDDGLVHLKPLTKLKNLWLISAPVTDAGLRHLSGLNNLQVLVVTGTEVTADGVAALKKALPMCKITSESPPE